MKTTINLPDQLIEKAQKELNIKNKTTLIIMGLQELIHQSSINKLRNLRGKIPLDIDLDKLRDRSHE
jgi:hypothetical protein